LDDSAGQIQVQLASDQAHSGLGWGHLTRVRSNAGREDFRGTGAEVRSDAHGALRTLQGLALSTQARPAGQGHVTDVADSTQALHQGLQQHGAMGDLALQHSAQEPKDQAKVAQALEDQHAGVTGKGALEEAAKEAAKDVVKAAAKDTAPGLPKPFPELAEPHVLVSGAAGIATTARESTQQYSENHHAISSAGHVGLSAGDSVAVSARESIRLFAFKGGLRLTAFGRKLELQAVKSSLLLRAKVDIVQTSQEIEIQAKSKVLLNGAGSFRRWDGSITTGTKGRWMVYAAGYGFKPGKSMAAPALRTAKGAPKLELHYQYDDLSAVAGAAYKLTFAGGEVLQGVLDADGRAVIENPPDGAYSVEYGESAVPTKPPAALEPKDWVDPKQQGSLAAQWRAAYAQKNKKGGV
jgi:type VI secretion system secreted protein VgrG